MDTIIFGDSLAGNYGIAPMSAWPQILAEDASLDISHVIFKNGYTTTDLLECLGREVLALAPDRVILICGSNDAMRMREFSAILGTVGLIARELQAQGAELVWLIPPLMDAGAASQSYGDPTAIYDHANQTLELVRQDRHQVGARTIDLEELRQAFLKEQPSAYTDGLHFGVEFQKYLAHALRKALFDEKP